MKEINYWQKFLNTGKVEDYLSYKVNDGMTKHEDRGKCPHAETFQRNRNNIEGGTFRGI